MPGLGRLSCLSSPGISAKSFPVAVQPGPRVPSRMSEVLAEEFLSRPIYEVNEAARLLRLPDKTLRRWLDGDWKQGDYTSPVLRVEETKSWVMTWGEFVEAGLLAQFRDPRLPIERLRPLIREAAETLGTAYPLARTRPLFSGDKQLLFNLQEKHGLQRELRLVQVRGPLHEGYQLVLTPVAERFVSRVEIDEVIGVVTRWFPALPSRRIVQDPEIAFGLPTINGVRTETLAELRAARESVNSILEVYRAFDLSSSDVRLATRFEAELAQAA